jgi:hypothetical protein
MRAISRHIGARLGTLGRLRRSSLLRVSCGPSEARRSVARRPRAAGGIAVASPADKACGPSIVAVRPIETAGPPQRGGRWHAAKPIACARPGVGGHAPLRDGRSGHKKSPTPSLAPCRTRIEPNDGWEQPQYVSRHNRGYINCRPATDLRHCHLAYQTALRPNVQLRRANITRRHGMHRDGQHWTTRTCHRTRQSPSIPIRSTRA